MLDGHPDVSWERGWEHAVNLIDSRGEVLAQQAEVEGVSGPGREALRDHLDQKAQAALGEKKILGVTVHVGFHKAPNLWEDAKYIHIIRDPRDIAISSVKLGWSGTYFHAPDIWVEAEREWESLKSTLPDDAWIDLRYEDFVTDPKSELDKVCAFLGVDYSEKLFDYIETSKYSYPKESLAYRWKDQLDQTDVQLIEARIGDMLTKSGYEPSTYPPVKVGRLAAVSLGLKDFLTIKAKHIRTEGFWVYMLGLTGRKLRLGPTLKLHRELTQVKIQDGLNKLEKNY